jgi:hypothetical protein
MPPTRVLTKKDLSIHDAEIMHVSQDFFRSNFFQEDFVVA